ncbi:MAG: hypothetical protein ACYDBB_10545 [Armatimonadota bacterium]
MNEEERRQKSELIKQVIRPQLEVRKALVRGEITWEQAAECIFNPRCRPWDMREWQALRDLHLQERCAQCASDTPPLVIQHTLQPRDLRTICRDVRGMLLDQYIQSHPIELDNGDLAPVDRNCCPKCNSTAIIFSKTKQVWVCKGKKGGWRSPRVCGHEFTQPGITKARTPVQKHERSRRWHEGRDQRWQAFMDAHSDEIMTKAILVSIREHIRYMAFVDTTTLCKKCAFLADMRGMVLCKACGERYHERSYPICYTCSHLCKA